MSKEWREMWEKAWPNAIGQVESQDKVGPNVLDQADKGESQDKAEEKLHKNIKKEQNIAKKTRKLKLRVLPDAPPNSPVSKSKSKSKSKTPSKKQNRLNETCIDVLERLSALMSKKGEPMRSRAYAKAQETIMMIAEDITDISQLKGKPAIGPTILSKLTEYVETGTLQLFEREKELPENILSDIYGVGPKKAKDLVAKGITTIAQLRERQDELLNANQKAGLKYYEDIMERIPREEIDEYNEVFKNVFDNIRKDKAADKYEIVGSYRRGARTSGDIDMIITSPDPTLFTRFVEALKTQNIIVEILSQGKTKCLVITKLPLHKVARRVDFMYTSQEEYPFAVLYFTGSKTFNTMMRGHALRQGVSLNEHGLYKKEQGKAKEEKVTNTFLSERDIFDYLHLKYKAPEQRTDGRAIISTDSTRDKEEPQEPQERQDQIVKVSKKTKRLKIKEPKEPKAKTFKIKVPKKQKEPHFEPLFKVPTPPTPRNTTEVIDIVPVIERQEPVEALMEKPKKQKRKYTLKIRYPNNAQETDLNTTSESIQKMSSRTPEDLINDFKQNGIQVLEHLPEKQLAEMLIKANDVYYNTRTTLMTDNEYDIVKEYVEKKYPKNEVLDKIGAPVQTKNKVTLPYQMPSMDKIKPDTNALANWKTKYKGPYVLSCKLDGVSGMYNTENGEAKLYTRGDGKVGQDISHLIKTLKLPQTSNFAGSTGTKFADSGFAVRGEFVLPKKLFDEKYKIRFANPRNLVSGIINSKTIDEKARDLHFVAYEIIHPQMKPREQMAKLKELGFEVVQNRREPQQNLTNEMLSETLMDWRTNYEYEIDGVIVANDAVYKREEGNPEHAFAFKMVISDQMAEAKVVDVLWTPSKSGYLKPRVRIEPIKLGGVTIEYATGFNGEFIETNKIGIGAVIQIIRSGDVIPHIKSVTTPAEHTKMPTVPYHWTSTHVDIVIDDVEEDETVREKNITAFFTTIEVDGLSTGNVKRLIKAGYNSVAKILHMNKSDYNGIDGFKVKMIDKIYDGIKDKVNAASLLMIMDASNKFGRGISMKKMKPIMEAYPDILTSSDGAEYKFERLIKIKGVGKENAKGFVDNIPNFMSFLRECGLEDKLHRTEESTNSSSTNASNTIELEDGQAPIQTPLSSEKVTLDNTHPLYGKHIVMTKVRDKTIIDGLKKVGGILDDNISKSTFVLITKSKDDVSNKTKYANQHDIPIMEPSEFIAKYL
jgi:NAD-dependent DNA ligase/DNA polymerase/3'-5' exonuclease PolX